MQAQDGNEGDINDDASSNQGMTSSPTATAPPPTGPLSAEAKRKRRQEINRESARRVRKRKSEAFKGLQEEVLGSPLSFSQLLKSLLFDNEFKRMACAH